MREKRKTRKYTAIYAFVIKTIIADTRAIHGNGMRLQRLSDDRPIRRLAGTTSTSTGEAGPTVVIPAHPPYRILLLARPPAGNAPGGRPRHATRMKGTLPRLPLSLRGVPQRANKLPHHRASRLIPNRQPLPRQHSPVARQQTVQIAGVMAIASAMVQPVVVWIILLHFRAEQQQASGIQRRGA